MKMNFTIPVAALIAGAALGYCLAPSQGAAEPEAKTAAETPRRKHLPDAGAEEQLKALRSRIKELEKALADSQREPEPAQESRVDEGRRRGRDGNGPNWREMRERLEQWKKDNPEEFARMEKRRQEFMQERARRVQSKLDFFSSIDTSRMSKSDRATHDELQGLIARREEIESKLFSMDTADEDRGQLFQEMHETERSIREKSEQERQNLLRMTAEELGLTGSDAVEVVDTISEIYEATSGGFGGPGPGPGGPGRRRGR